MSNEKNRITIRGGEVFVSSGARLEDVSIYSARVICDCKQDSYEGLVAFLEARARGVIVTDCVIESADRWVKRKSDALLKADFESRLQIVFTPPKVSLWERIVRLFK
jgi:hypothetical protein